MYKNLIKVIFKVLSISYGKDTLDDNFKECHIFITFCQQGTNHPVLDYLFKDVCAVNTVGRYRCCLPGEPREAMLTAHNNIFGFLSL